MEKHFATYNQSLALKELGFDEPSMAFYQVEYTEESPVMVDDDSQYRLTGWRTCRNSEIPKHYTSAPLKSQVFEWMRDKHILSAHIDDFTANDGQVRYDFSIRELGSQDDNPNGVYEEYSDAESACIDALIKRVKQRL